MPNNTIHRKAQPAKQLTLAIVTKTADGAHCILGLLDDPKLLHAALERLVDNAANAVGAGGDPISIRANFARLRVYKEMLSAL